MKLKFKIQNYQTDTVKSVTDCFAGQVNTSGISYRIDPGKESAGDKQARLQYERIGFRNSEIQLSAQQLLENIREVQRRQNIPISDRLAPNKLCNSKINLDVEMETGTGKTYCYIKTIFEMNKLYGWSKFIIVVPSIAIREGVYKSFQITTDHFTESYGKKARFFIYNSKQLHHIESFSSDAGINVMIINIQAFNATGKDNRRIYEELDDFQSRKPIDVISSNRPILILDEPQKMEGDKTLKSLASFNPLFILRYSATLRTIHNKIHRLDALDAYNQKLVKKIAVRGIGVKGLAGTNAYMYLQSIDVSTKAPVARLEIEVKQGSGIKRVLKRLEAGRNLFVEANELNQYKGFVIRNIDANRNVVDFTNGNIIEVGEATGDITEMALRRIQIREAIRAHLNKETILFDEKIKVLSLFFIDEVAKYRDYGQPDEQGEYARIFEEEYEVLKKDYLGTLPLNGHSYRKYLEDIPVRRTHNGYFSIDKKTKRLTDPTFKVRGEEAGLSDDVVAYDLILKDKERLLSLQEPVRFIFSHSALREGWDNPNVFVMCMLKHSDNTISRRQEVGRGMRLSVNDQGDRMDSPATVHDINVLTVVANESYKDFVLNLQSEISASLSERPRKADEAYFTGKFVMTEEGRAEITPPMAKQIYKYLVKNDYVDDNDQISQKYYDDKSNGCLVELPVQLMAIPNEIFKLIEGVFSDAHLPEVADDRKLRTNRLNHNFNKKEFLELWNRINHKAVYRVDFDSNELIEKAVSTLNRELRVTPLMYTVQSGSQVEQVQHSDLKSGLGFKLETTTIERHDSSIYSMVTYDLLGKLTENTQLTRKTIAKILINIQKAVFDQFKKNPEEFISEAARLINEQKATIIIERLSYNEIDQTYDKDIFTAGQFRQDFTRATERLKRHIYDHAITDSKNERAFVGELDTSSEVAVYAKLPRGFLIPTPVGDYNPDWAISFKEGSVKHIYFVAETKGDMSSLQLRAVEEKKIECAKKFFEQINGKSDAQHVKYDVVDSFGKLMEIVGIRRAVENL
ncbi:MAG: DEAD/DEAH box helicase family protein [Deltaproteobacteria bacterium]|nr:DEAD/DEAH box helicase family protein [Deltaproteobacteria bacterium]